MVDIHIDPSTRNLSVGLRPGDEESADNAPLAAHKRDLFTTVEIRSPSAAFDPGGAIAPPGGTFFIAPDRILWHDELGLEHLDFGPVIAAGVDPRWLETHLEFDAITANGGVLGDVHVLIPEPSSSTILISGVGLLALRRRSHRRPRVGGT